MSGKSDRPQNKPDMLIGPGKKQIFGISLFAQKIEAFTCHVGFLASLFVPFAGSILPGWRFLLLCSLSLSLIVPRGEEFFSAKIQPGRALAFSPFRASCRRGEKRRRRKTDELVLWLADDV